MPKTKSISGVLVLPETKLNFVLYLGEEEEPKGADVNTISRILEKAYNLTPEMQVIIADFADYLAKKPKSGGQAPPT